MRALDRIKEQSRAWRSLSSALVWDSDAYFVVQAGNPFSLLDQGTESAMLVDRLDKAPKLDDTIVHCDTNMAVIDPGLRPDAAMQRLMQKGVIDLLARP